MALLDGIVGHGPVGALLEREAARPAQAYLFVGPSNVGKGTVARRFAATLVCPLRGNHEGVCETCRRVVSGNHPDVTIVRPDGASSLSVDQAREVIARAPLAPVEADRKVIVFDEAGLMTEQAANAMLKTLEEPTLSTVFVLVAESEFDLPATVVSRCRTVQFGRLREVDLVDALIARGVEEQQAREAASIAGGRPGLALDLAQRPEVSKFRAVWLGVPLQVSPHPGEMFRLSDQVMEASEPLLDAIRERQVEEAELVDGRASKERQERIVRQASRSLLVAGLEILASWYSDAASAQFAGPVRNRDVPAATLALVRPVDAVGNAERVLAAIPDVRANLRPQLVLAALFTELAPVV
jgi:DNA polymerase III subunit delta'